MNKAQIPLPLQHRILLQSGLALLSAIAGLGVSWACGDIRSGAPFMIAAILLACGAAHLYQIALKRHYIVLHCTVLYVERTFWQRRPKALLLEAEGYALRVCLWNRLQKLSAGDVIDLYISDTTPLYIWGGVRHISTYLALAPVPGKNFLREKPSTLNNSRF